MHAISDATRYFSFIDKVPVDEIPSLDKSLRNYANRFYLPHDDQRGRVFLYGDASIVALRMVFCANVFGLDRWMCEDYARWLARPGERKEKVDGGHVGISICREAIDRVKAGEEFHFHVALYAGSRLRIFADWQPDTPRSERVERALNSKYGPEIARYTAPASAQIRALLDVFGAN